MFLTVLFSWLWALLLSPTPTSTIALAKNTDTIYWQPSRKLTWDDFRGRPNRSDESVALTSSGIGMVFRSGADGVPKIDVTCTFFCKNSWVKNEGRNDTVLQHEQLHFDLTELYARKLRKAVDQLKPADRKWPTIQKIYTGMNRECDERQNRYDRETNHGIRRTPQQEWQARVANELKELEPYRSE